MTQSPNDRLDWIEAALDRQVQVNADLRTSTEVLKNSVNTINNSVAELTSSEVLKNSVDTINNSVAELTSSTESILQVVNQHQENLMVLVSEIRHIRTDIRRILNRLYGEVNNT